MFQGRTEATGSQQQGKCAAKPLGLQGVEAPRISRQSVYEDCKVISTMHRLTLPPGDISDTSVRGHSQAGRIKSMKNLIGFELTADPWN
jgi:hypothetical protein